MATKRLRLHREIVRNLQAESRTLQALKTPGLRKAEGGSSAICTLISLVSPATEAPSGCICTPLYFRTGLAVTRRTLSPHCPGNPEPDPNRPHATYDLPCYSQNGPACW